jgi:two-component system alkaline phosphatase synthesis response regulator PhoP/two-component system response regulator VicR
MSTEPPSPQPEPNTHAAPLILAVDDEAEIRNILEFTLMAEGYRVALAQDGQGALEQVALQKPDLVIMDVTMPKLDGFEALRRLKEDPATENLPVIMLTGLAQEADILAGWLRGADLYLTKPFDPFELLAHVLRVLRETGVTDDDYYRSLT